MPNHSMASILLQIHLWLARMHAKEIGFATMDILQARRDQKENEKEKEWLICFFFCSFYFLRFLWKIF